MKTFGITNPRSILRVGVTLLLKRRLMLYKTLLSREHRKYAAVLAFAKKALGASASFEFSA
jgi:hypothetical protein